MPRTRTPPACVLTAMLIAMVGCDNGKSMVAAREAYERSDYRTSYTESVKAARDTGRAHSDEAAYLAGMSAYHLQDYAAARRYLEQAARSVEGALAGRALAQLGLIDAEQSRYASAAQNLTAAATRLAGEDRANAYYYAGLAHQKVGQWGPARANLTQARTLSYSPVTRQRAELAMNTVGWTLQVGAYSNHENARRAADALSKRVMAARLGTPRFAPTISDGKSLILVQVGRWDTHAAATAAKTTLGEATAIVAPMTK